MNIYDFTTYVNQDVDDTFSTEEIARWFNKAIANYNLIPPVTRYPYITMDVIENIGQTAVDQFTGTESYNTDSSYYANGGNATDDEIGAYTDYPLSKTFMLAVMLPFVASSVKTQESSVTERQVMLSEFSANARTFKTIENVPIEFLLDRTSIELELYRVGENAYLTDFNENPFAGDWKKASSYKEVVISRKKDGTLVRYVDNSLKEEDIETMDTLYSEVE